MGAAKKTRTVTSSYGTTTSTRNLRRQSARKRHALILSLQLRAALLECRDRRMLEAFTAGKTGSLLDELVFPSPEGSVLDPDNLVKRYFLPTIEHAGLRRFKFHDLRHTFGSMLIQRGASLAYVKEQMGHSSIQVTVDTYGHLIRGANVHWVDRLDTAKNQQQSATNSNSPDRVAPRIPRSLLKKLVAAVGLEPTT